MGYETLSYTELAGYLTGLGFAKGIRGKECIFERATPVDERLWVIVYTSVRVGHEKAKPSGQDAIRVCMVARTPHATHGVASTKRVNRTGPVEEVTVRVRSRIVELYEMASRMQRLPCSKCGAPCFENSGRCSLRCGGSAPAPVVAATVAQPQQQQQVQPLTGLTETEMSWCVTLLGLEQK